MRNGLEIVSDSIDLPCSREDHRPFSHGMCQTVVEPCLCRDVQDDQNVMVKLFSYNLMRRGGCQSQPS